ncbi:MAG: isochorismatase family protein [Myxococcota bacterium]
MRSGEVNFDQATALIIVDVQNDFANPEGNLHVPGGEDVIPEINALIDQARRREAFIVYTQDWHPHNTPHFQKNGGEWPVHCVKETWGAELHPELVVAGPIVKKGTGGEDGYSGFMVRDPESGEETPTQLGPMLKERGIERVVIVGLAQDVCVQDTALDAQRLGFRTIVVADATRPVNAKPGDGARAVAKLVQAGAEVH